MNINGSMQLDIKARSISEETAAAVYNTLLSGLTFVIDYLITSRHNIC